MSIIEKNDMFLSPLFLFIASLTNYVTTEAFKMTSTHNCAHVRSLLSTRAFHTPSVVFNNASYYPSTHNLCNPAIPPLENCCSVIYTPDMGDGDYLEMEQLRVTRWLEPIFSDLLNDSLFFQTFFVDSLNLTMSRLDKNFMNSYGYNYKKNRDFFVDFFANLESYMLGKRQNLSALVDDFFHELLRRIVRLLLFAKSESDLNAADCISAELEKKNPFERIPESIKKMTLRAFPPARIIANALLIGSETISTVMHKMKFTKACHIEWIKLRYCGLCTGHVHAMPCPNVCRLVMARCLSDYALLAEPWTQFIDNLIALTGRLRDSDSFPQVNRPLQIHITDAIMNFQRFFSHIDQSLMKSCNYRGAQPPGYLHRQRRQLHYPIVPPHLASRSDPVDYFQSLPSLANQAKLLREKYLPIRSLFEASETVFCSGDLLHASNLSVIDCWDGERVLPKDRPLSTSPPASSRPNPVVTRLVSRLRHITQMLRDILHADSDPDFLHPEVSFLLDKSNSPLELQSTVNVLIPHDINHLNTSRLSDFYDSVSSQSIHPQVSQTIPSLSPPVDRLDAYPQNVPSEGSGFITVDETSSLAPALQPSSTVFRPISGQTSSESGALPGIAWDDEDWPEKDSTLFRQTGPMDSEHQLVHAHHPADWYVEPPQHLWQTRGQYEKPDRFSPAELPSHTMNTPHNLASDKSSAHLSSRINVRGIFVKPPNQLWIPHPNYMRYVSNEQLASDSYSGSDIGCVMKWSRVLSYILLFIHFSDCIAL